MLERRASDGIALALRTAVTGDDLLLAPSEDLCSTLEVFLPQLLTRDYPKWEWESLDGIFVARARKLAPTSLQLLGTAILTGDQTLTPLAAEFTLAPSLQKIEAYCVLIGEPGGGPLGISGPPCDSDRGYRFRDRIEARIDSGQVNWVYRASSASA